VAQYDSADLLARCKVLAQRPAVDEDMDDPKWYQFLEEAQTEWVGQIANHAPEVMYGPPELMTTPDGGATYTVAGYPLGYMEIRSSRGGPLLRPGAEWDDNADFTQEGQIIRIPSGRTRSFGSTGPYARYVAVPGLLNGATQPVLKPAHMRLLLVATACYLFATRGGYRDPTPYLQLQQKLWHGDPNLPGDIGFLGSLKTQYFGSGMAAIQQGSGDWWRGSPDLR
jgi:hypothetical protein